MRLGNKVVLVTAATRGIGLAIAAACLQEGAAVWLAGRDPERTARACATLGAGAHPLVLDATRGEDYAPAMEKCAREAGRIDVLVNNFGISDRRRDLTLRETAGEDFLKTVQVNLMSVYLATRAALPHMGRGGSVVNISSLGGSVPDVTQVGYGTAKAAINHLTKVIALQEAANGIRCNAIAPGMTATDAVKTHLTEEFRQTFLRRIPLGRMGLPEEIAQAAVYLASDESAYTTGQILTISGGFGLGTPLYRGK